MKMLENLLLDDQEAEMSKFRWIYNNYDCDQCNLEEISLEIMEKTFHRIFIPTYYANVFTPICSLPGNRSFCFSSDSYGDEESSFVLIIDENHNIQRLRSDLSTIGHFATFYDNYVYMFGEGYLFRYNLLKRRWEKITAILYEGNFGTCISFNGMILFIWHDSQNIRVFDLQTFSHSSCLLNLNNANKILCKSKNVAYLIDFSGLIWESEIGNPYIWNIVGTCHTLRLPTYSAKVFYKNSWYFNIRGAVIKFNLDKKTVEEIRTSITYEYIRKIN